MPFVRSCVWKKRREPFFRRACVWRTQPIAAADLLPWGIPSDIEIATSLAQLEKTMSEPVTSGKEWFEKRRKAQHISDYLKAYRKTQMHTYIETVKTLPIEFRDAGKVKIERSTRVRLCPGCGQPRSLNRKLSVFQCINVSCALRESFDTTISHVKYIHSSSASSMSVNGVPMMDKKVSPSACERMEQLIKRVEQIQSRQQRLDPIKWNEFRSLLLAEIPVPTAKSVTFQAIKRIVTANNKRFGQFNDDKLMQWMVKLVGPNPPPPWVPAEWAECKEMLLKWTKLGEPATTSLTPEFVYHYFCLARHRVPYAQYVGCKYSAAEFTAMIQALNRDQIIEKLCRIWNMGSWPRLPDDLILVKWRSILFIDKK